MPLDLDSALGLMDAAIAQGDAPSSGGSPAPQTAPVVGGTSTSSGAPPSADAMAPLTIRPRDRTPTQDAMAQIDAVLAQPKEKVIASAGGAQSDYSGSSPDYLPGASRGSAAPNPYGTLNRSAFGSAPPASAPSTDGAADALNAVEGTGEANYATGPAEDGLTPGQRAAGLPGLSVNMLSQAAQGVPIIGAGVNKAAAGLASLVNGRSVADNETTGQGISDDFAAAHPGLTTAARTGGAILGTLPLIEAAPGAFGMEGPAAVRLAAGAGSGAALGAGDAAVRGDDAGKGALYGAAGGALGPVLKGGAYAAGKIAGGVGKVAGAVRDVAAPFTAAGQQRTAATIVRDAMSTPDATIPALGQDGTILPGVKPTAFQQSGDLGLGQLEMAARDNPNRAPKYIARDEQQNAARVGAIDAIAPDASPMTAANAFTGQGRAVGAQGDAAVTAARAAADDATSGLGGAGTIDTHGQAIGDTLAPAYRGIQDTARGQVAALGGDQSAATYGGQIKAGLDPQFQAAQDAARSQVDALGGTGSASDRGVALRAPARGAEVDAADRLSQAYAAVPDDVAANIAPVKRLARSLYGDPEPAVAQTMTPAENGIADALSQYGNDVTFGSARNIDTMLTGAMRQELASPAGRSPAYRRLVQLKSAWEDSIHNSGALDGAAGGSGGIAPALSTADASIPAPSGSSVQAPASGSSVFTPSGRQVDVDYRVMDAGDVSASHLADGRPNPAYPPELQPRDRTRAASDAQIADMASNLQPERLGASSSAADGAPIVGPDGHVESGNGRVLAINRAYDQNGPAASRYRDYLEGQGYDTGGMTRPILVRQRTTPLAPAERVRFAQEANASPVMTASATERAGADAGRMSDNTLASYQGGDVGSAANRPFVQSFMRDAAEKGEQGGFAGPDGSLSLDGQRRVQNAMLHAAYGDPALVSSIAETGDDALRAFGGVMQDSAGRVAQLRRSIAAGHVDPAADLSGPMVEAARVVQRARSTGQRIGDVVAQQDAFSPISGNAQHLLRLAYGEDLAGRISRSRMTEQLGSVLSDLGRQTTEARLFGEPMTAGQVLEGATARYGTGQATGTSDGFAPRAFDPGQGAGAQGVGGRGPRARAPGPDVSGAGGSGWRAPPTGRALGPDDVAALDAAKDLTKANKGTFGTGAPGKILKPGPTAGTFRVPDSGVPDAVFPRGPGGYEAVRSYRNAVGSDDQAIGALHDTAAASLRRNALRDDGTIDPGKFAAWRRNYGEALRGVPELSDAFDTASHAADTLDRFGSYSPNVPASSVPEMFFRSGPKGSDAVRQLQGLMPGTSGSEALAGSAAYSLRKAALRDDGTLDPAKFATWRNSHAEALGALPPGVGQAFDTAARATAALDRFGKFTPDLPTSKIPSLFFNPGPAGADGVRMLRSLTDDETASHLLGDYAAFSLQSKAIGEDGGFNAKAARNWMAAHKPALDALPAEVGQRFKTVAEAHEAVADAVAAKKASVEAFNDTAAAKLAGVEDPDEVVKRLATILKAPDATAQMRSLVKAAGDDDAAVAGLKRAAAEVVKGKALSVNEAGTSGVNQMTNSGFGRFMGQSAPALRELLSPDEFGTMVKVGETLTQANRSVAAVKGNKGGPGTAQGVKAMIQEVEHKGGVLGQILVHGAPALVGHFVGESLGLGGEIGAMAGLFGSSTIGAARSAGLRTIDDLVDRALLDPQFARTLAMKAPAKSQAADAAMRFQFGRIGRATALGLAAGQSAPARQAGGSR